MRGLFCEYHCCHAATRQWWYCNQTPTKLLFGSSNSNFAVRTTVVFTITKVLRRACTTVWQSTHPLDHVTNVKTAIKSSLSMVSLINTLLYLIRFCTYSCLWVLVKHHNLKAEGSAIMSMIFSLVACILTSAFYTSPPQVLYLFLLMGLVQC